MRIMDDVILENGLDAELEDRLDEGNAHFDHDMYDDIDESSDDAMDPDEEQRATIEGLRAEAADQSAMVEAVRGALECRSVLLDLERARMELEDLRSRQLRA